jgi:putative ABC transport system permease protein
MQLMMREIKFAFRTLAKRRSFSLITILVLALGIGANTAIFSVVNAVLLRPLPFTESERLVQIWHVPPAKSFPGMTKFSLSPANYLDWQAQNTTLDMSIYRGAAFTLTGTSHPQPVIGASVSPEFFSVLKEKPIAGRTFAAADGTTEAGQTVVVSEAFWRSNLGGNPNIVGQVLRLNDQPHTVIGVMPSSFVFPPNTPAPQVWTCLQWTAKDRAVRGNHNYLVIGRLKPGASLEQAQAQLSAISKRLEQQYPEDDAGWGANIVPLREELVGDVRPALLILLGAVAFVLLIACANVANLVLATTLSRRKELAIRTALGATQWALIRQILIETVLLAIVGGVFGLFFAHFGVQLIINFLSDQLPRVREVHLDGEVLMFTLGVSLVTGLLAGFLPAWRLGRADINESLKQGLGKTDSDSSGGKTRNLLVVSEVALSLVLLVGAGLMIRTLYHLQRMDSGLDPHKVLTVAAPIPKSKYDKDEQKRAFYDQVIQKVRALPGVDAAGAIDDLPIMDGGSTQPIGIEGRPVLQLSDQPEVAVRKIMPGYLKSMSIPVVRGRDISDGDTVNRVPVILISESLAKEFFPNEDPIGKHLTLGLEDAGRDLKPTPREIVGIVRDVKVHGLDNNLSVATVYDPFYQMPSGNMTLTVRTAGDPSAIGNAVTNGLHSVDPEVSILDISTMNQVIDFSLAPRRFTMLLLVAFAGLALLLAAVGIYGVLSYAVRRRVREIGIRMALGAQIRDVIRMIVIDGMTPVVIGVIIGVIASFALSRVLTSVVYGVSSRDSLTFGSVSVLLLMVALIASAFPAYRAAQVQPVRTLREE